MMRLMPLLFVAWLGLSDARGELSTDRTDWSDLSRFKGLAETSSTAVVTGTRLDLGTLPAKAGLALFDPDASMTTANLPLFVQEGGRLLLAVESDSSASLLAAFGISLGSVPGGVRRFQDHEALPLIRPNARTSPLFSGLKTLVSNRPRASAHRDDVTAVAVFSDGTPFGYHLKFGTGEVLVLSDASLFINSMLPAKDNEALAQRVVRWLGRDGSGPIWIGGQSVQIGGRYGETVPRTMADRVNAVLGRVGQNASPDRALVLLLLTLILAGALVFVMGVFPGGHQEAPTPWRSHHIAVTTIEGRAGLPGGPADPRPGPGDREEKRP